MQRKAVLWKQTPNLPSPPKKHLPRGIRHALYLRYKHTFRNTEIQIRGQKDAMNKSCKGQDSPHFPCPWWSLRGKPTKNMSCLLWTTGENWWKSCPLPHCPFTSRKYILPRKCSLTYPRLTMWWSHGNDTQQMNSHLLACSFIRTRICCVFMEQQLHTRHWT